MDAILVTELGIVMPVSALQYLNESASISVSEEVGNVTLFSPLHPVKALLLIVVTEFGIVTLDKLYQF